MDIEYTWVVDIMAGENFLQTRLLTWTSLIDQFLHPYMDEWCRYFNQLTVFIYQIT